MTRAICSKLWTDIDIRMPASRISNCCKSWQWENYSPQQIREMGTAFFNARPELIHDKTYMIEKDKLPPNCGECAAQFPGGYFGGHNVWLKKEWQNNEIKELINTDCTNHIEIMLSTTCNMSCMYCSELVSSTWADIKGVEKNDVNQEWQDAVFDELYKYIPTLNKNLFFNFTGGEPLLEWNIFDIIEKISYLANKNFKHQIMITTNLNIKPKLLERFFEIVESNPRFQWRLSVSIDEVGESKLRDGLDWNRFEENLKLVANNNTLAYVNFLPSITNLSIPLHEELVKYLQGQKIKAHKEIGNNMVYGPKPMSLTIAPRSFRKYLEKAWDAAIPGSHKNFLRGCIRNIGIERTKENIEQATKFFEEQSKWKNIDYYKIYPHLEEILDISVR